MRLIAFGGDERMSGALAAARARGWETLHVRTREEAQEPVGADAVLLPWPRSFEKETLLGGELGRAQTLSAIPACRAALIGSDVRAQEVPQAGMAVLPGRDETFLLKNAVLTAEGALFAAHAKTGRALAGRSCLVTGFGRIGRALAARPALGPVPCVACGKCASMCPAGAIRISGGRAHIDRKACIRCFCCQEFCPVGAMIPKRSAVARLLIRRKS